MAVFKCKMCGGSLEVTDNNSVALCTYCGTQQTIPRFNDEKKLALFTRANNLRLKSEFDKAAGIYESIITEFRDEAEAYWGLVLCKYGIEYVDDGNGRKVPTCHRTLPVAIMDDDDFQQACENADVTAKSIYREEAKNIDKIQKKILSIAINEEPYDIFICYKETDDITGLRTEDSEIAQDIYAQLLKDGYRVFYSRLSLREVAGTEYEPYIYAALSSAKVMLAVGTKFEYFDSVWVKNEWSRYISMMADSSSKVLIPCIKNMDAYDMPKEFKNMQALDMNDVTFFASLLESIERIVDKTRSKASKESIIFNDNNIDISPLLEQGFLFIEDNEWDRADEFFESVLNKDPKNGNAYLGKLLVDLKLSSVGDLSSFRTTFSDNNNYEKIMHFGEDELKEKVRNCNEIVARRIEENRKKELYQTALKIMQTATTEQMFENAGYMFQEVKDYADAKQKSAECFEKGELARIEYERQQELEHQRKENALKDEQYRIACLPLEYDYENISTKKYVDTLNKSILTFNSLGDWRDSKNKALLCQRKKEEAICRELAQESEHAKQEKSKNYRILIFVAVSIIICLLLMVLLIKTDNHNGVVFIPDNLLFFDNIVPLYKLIQ